jgi:hypothetical protein
VASSINPGTAALQTLLAHESNASQWQARIGPNGFIATYQKLFGDPMSYSLDPVIPPNFNQPALRLPWEDGHVWYMTGGPHGGWSEGSGWDAVDFAPTSNAGTCFPSAEWAVAAASGRVTQAEHGRVMVNLSNSKFQGDGWSLLYMHMATYQRVAVGAQVKSGDHIGHPSCEGGLSQADHLHFARLYNGQWIAAADSQAPFTLAGWVLQNATREYDGSMVRGGDIREACNCHNLELNGLLAESQPQAGALVSRVEANNLKPAQNNSVIVPAAATTNRTVLPASIVNPASNSTAGASVTNSNSNGAASNASPILKDDNSRVGP